MGTTLNRRSGTRSRRVLALAAVVSVASGLLAFGHVASADVADPRQVPPSYLDVDDDIPPVRNLQTYVQETKKGRDFAIIGWERPEDQWAVSGYRVLYSADYRPQKWMVLKTSEPYVKLSKLWPGRTYTVIVQATSPLSLGWGEPAEITVTTADSRSCSVAGPPRPGAEPCYESDAPWVVSLGDSFISGEGGRWAGNASLLPGLRSEIDTGVRAYYDYQEGETIEACHRSLAAMIHITVAKSVNFACSGAITVSEAIPGALRDSNTGQPFSWTWKPGVDAAGPDDFPQLDLEQFGPVMGQAEMLAQFARGRDVKMVVLSIGGNNFHFGDIVTKCVLDYLSSGNCKDREELQAFVSESWQDRVRGEVKTAIQEIVWAMRRAGHADGTWTLVQTLYPKPIATKDMMRYTEFDEIPDGTYEVDYRHAKGGCGFRDVDADWAIKTVLPTINETIREAALEAKAYFENQNGHLRLVQLDNSDAFRGHELCHKNSKRVNSFNVEDRGGVKSWRNKKAADKSEWVKEIELAPVGAVTLEEGFHPGYWGQLALRNCVRQVWNGGDVSTGGVCTPLTGTNRQGEPNMAFAPDPSLTHTAKRVPQRP